MTRGNGKGRTSLMPTEVGDPYFPGARGGAGSDCAQTTPQTVQTIAWFGTLRQAPRGLQTFLRTTLDTTQEAPLAIVDGNSSMTIRARPTARQQRPQETTCEHKRNCAHGTHNNAHRRQQSAAARLLAGVCRLVRREVSQSGYSDHAGRTRPGRGGASVVFPA